MLIIPWLIYKLIVIRLRSAENIMFFLGFAPPNTISRPGRSQTCCQRNFQINALRFSHSSWSRQVCVKNRYFYKIGRKKKFKKIKFYFSLKLYRLSQCRIFVVDDDNVTKLSQLTPYELNLQRKRNIMVRKFSNFLKNIRAHLANIIHGYDWSKADGTAVSNIGHISFFNQSDDLPCLQDLSTSWLHILDIFWSKTWRTSLQVIFINANHHMKL